MAINTRNDEVEVFQDGSGGYRWRRVDRRNGKIVSTGAEAYTREGYAEEAAEAYNPGLSVVVIEHS